MRRSTFHVTLVEASQLSAHVLNVDELAGLRDHAHDAVAPDLRAEVLQLPLRSRLSGALLLLGVFCHGLGPRRLPSAFE